MQLLLLICKSFVTIRNVSHHLVNRLLQYFVWCVSICKKKLSGYIVYAVAQFKHFKV